MIKVAVIAGTPVDTQMGVDFIESMNKKIGNTVVDPLYMPVSENCDDQIKFQYSDTAAKRRRIDEIFDEAFKEDVRDFFIYCNSLSGAFDFDSYAEEKSEETGERVSIYTPLQIYRQLGSKFSRIGVMSAHNLSAHNIEETLMSSNADLYVIGTGNMAIVSSIEEGLDPAEIVRKCGLEYMVKYMEMCECEALLLGCTHFPYLRKELDKICSLEIIDPAEEMFAEILEANEFEADEKED